MLKREKRKIKNTDKSFYHLLIISAILVLFGILILASVSTIISYERFQNSYYYLVRQLKNGLIPGIILALVFFKINLYFLKRISPFLFGFTLLLISMTLIPFFGVNYGGATRWIEIGPISFQPAEFLKITFILFFASWLQDKIQNNIPERKIRRKFSKDKKYNFLYVILIFSIIGFILFYQKDLSTLGVILVTGFLMYFSSGTPVWQNIIIIMGLLSSCWLLIKTTAFRIDRILIFLNPDLDPLGKGYQIKQSLIAIGSGGLTGLGLGMSIQRFGFLPESMSDTIFSILAEETGFIGAIILISAFIIFLWQGIIIAKKTTDLFLKFTALGITSWIFLQACVNVGAMINLFPLTGIPLPFISYGGSHLVAELIGIGILLNISRQGLKK